MLGTCILKFVSTRDKYESIVASKHRGYPIALVTSGWK